MVLNIYYHIYEFIFKIRYLLTSFGFTFCISYLYSEQLVYVNTKSIFEIYPLKYLIYTNITEVFFTYIRISLLTSALLIIPLFIFYLWVYIRPALYKSEEVTYVLFSILSLILYIFSLLLVFKLILPYSWDFFLNLEGILFLELQAKISELINTIIKTILVVSVATQYPLIILLLVEFNLLSVNRIVKYRSVILITLTVISSIITPPDLISLFVLICPLFILYEIITLFLIFLHKYIVIYISKTKYETNIKRIDGSRYTSWTQQI